MAAVSAAGDEDEKLKVNAVFDAGVGGSTWRHVPSAPATVVCVVGAASPPRIMVVTTAPGAVCPHTTADCGARCSTMCDPRVAERKFSFSSS